MSSPFIRSSQFGASFSEAAAEAARQSGVDARVAFAIGEQASRILRQRHAGERVYIPKGVVHAGERAAEFYAMRQEGESVAGIAAHFGVTRSWVYELVNREKARLKAIRERIKPNQ